MESLKNLNPPLISYTLYIWILFSKLFHLGMVGSQWTAHQWVCHKIYPNYETKSVIVKHIIPSQQCTSLQAMQRWLYLHLYDQELQELLSHWKKICWKLSWQWKMPLFWHWQWNLAQSDVFTVKVNIELRTPECSISHHEIWYNMVVWIQFDDLIPG